VNQANRICSSHHATASQQWHFALVDLGDFLLQPLFVEQQLADIVQLQSAAVPRHHQR